MRLVTATACTTERGASVPRDIQLSAQALALLTAAKSSSETGLLFRNTSGPTVGRYAPSPLIRSAFSGRSASAHALSPMPKKRQSTVFPAPTLEDVQRVVRELAASADSAAAKYADNDRRARTATWAHPGGMSSHPPVVVHRPRGSGGRRVTIRDQIIGVAYTDRDLAEFLREVGLDGEYLVDSDSPMIEWRGGNPHQYDVA